MARTHVEEGENWVSYAVLDLHTCTMSVSTQTHTKKWILKKLKKNHLYIKQKKLFLLQTVFPHVNSHRLLKDRGDQLWRRDPVKHPEHYGGRIFLETRQGRQCKWCRVWPQVDTKKTKGCCRGWNSTFSNSERASLQLYFLCRVISSCNLFTSICNCRTSSVFWYSF